MRVPGHRRSLDPRGGADWARPERWHTDPAVQQAAIEQAPGAPAEGDEEPGETPVVGIEIRPPARLAVGRGSAFALGGYCYEPEADTERIAIEVDGERTEVDQIRLPRADVFERARGAAPDAGARAFHSGFIALARVRPRPAAVRTEVRLILSLADGRELSAPAGEISLEPSLTAPEAPALSFSDDGPRVAICMASYDPPPDLFRRQIESLREQTHRNWVCVISDDCSTEERVEAIQGEIDGDERFALSRSAGRLGFYSNFERALAIAPASAEFITLCDQDDRWHPDKLERLLERMRDGVELAYSDARVVDPDGSVLHPSYWTTRRTNHTNLASLLIANTVTGAASMFRAELLEDLLPFPPRLGEPFHDHWLSLVALARGEIDYLDRPLYDYVQHPEAVIGHSRANRRPLPVRERLRERLRNPGDGSRIVYFYNLSQQLLFAEILRMRCGEAMSAQKRRALGRFASVDASMRSLTWLLARRLRRLWGRNETMDIERFYAKALLRKRLVSLWTRGRRRPPRLLNRDARIPPAPTYEGAP